MSEIMEEPERNENETTGDEVMSPEDAPSTTGGEEIMEPQKEKGHGADEGEREESLPE